MFDNFDTFITSISKVGGNFQACDSHFKINMHLEFVVIEISVRKPVGDSQLTQPTLKLNHFFP